MNQAPKIETKEETEARELLEAFALFIGQSNVRK